MLSLAVLAWAVALPSTTTPVTSMLILPITVSDGAPEPLAAHVTNLLAYQLGKHPGVRVITYKEIETLVGAEQVKQLAGCSDVSCALEIAGALSADETLQGTLGIVQQHYIFTLARFKTRQAAVVSRAVREVPVGHEAALLGALPAVVAELMGDAPPVPAWVTRLRTAGLVGSAVAAVPLLLALAGGATALTITAVDVINGDWSKLPRQHGVSPVAALLGDGAYGLTGIMLVVFGVGLVTCAAMLGTAWVKL